MLEKYNVRTDLALEEKERFEADHMNMSGVIVEEEYDEESEIRMTKVCIETENGAKTLGKPVGIYWTIEAPDMAVPDEDYHQEISDKLLLCIRELIDQKIKGKEEMSVLVVGLGNRKVTPDALGPFVADNLDVTRHIVKEYGKYAINGEKTSLVSALVPGVMGQTGMETLEIVKGVVQETTPDLVIAVDALAARNSKRLNRTIQISDAGIHPGSGVGNHRNGITKETVGIPVIGIGVPTVVDAATIVNDTMENLVMALETSEALKNVGEVLRTYRGAEKYELIRELISPHLNGMFVTPKNEDELVKCISYTISEALNRLFANTNSEESKKEDDDNCNEIRKK